MASRSPSYDESAYVGIGSGIVNTPRPMTIFYGEDTNETRFFGELYVRIHPSHDIRFLLLVPSGYK